MEANKILHADILDIIFEGKNKMYGAYQLRKTYNKTLAKAMITTGSLLILILVGTVLASSTHKPTELITGPVIEIGKIHEDPPPPTDITPPPAAQVPNQIRFVRPVVVDNDRVDPAEIIQNISETQTISTETIHTDVTTTIIQAPIVDVNSQINEPPVKKEKEPDVYIDVQVPATFPGGFLAWKKYLEDNLDHETAINNGASEGTYSVRVRFIVSTDGSISNVVPETKTGYGLEAEAVKIIQKGPKWIPALQNGRQVTAYHSQLITFVVNQ